jgi:hypothetical protein
MSLRNIKMVPRLEIVQVINREKFSCGSRSYLVVTTIFQESICQESMHMISRHGIFDFAYFVINGFKSSTR